MLACDLSQFGTIDRPVGRNTGNQFIKEVGNVVFDLRFGDLALWRDLILNVGDPFFLNRLFITFENLGSNFLVFGIYGEIYTINKPPRL